MSGWGLRIFHRVQKKCQPGDNAGDDEDGYVSSFRQPSCLSRSIKLGFAFNQINSGHVEKTNDRDYEVEERYNAT